MVQLNLSEVYTMQRVAKGFDEKIQTINKIQNNLRKKRNTHIISSDSDSIELPLILNSLGISTKQKTEIQSSPFHPPSARNLNSIEYNRIFTQTLSQFKNQQINRIIFASPLTNRVSLGKTLYQNNLHATNDTGYTNLFSPKKRKQSHRRKEDITDLSFSPIKLKQKETTSKKEPIQMVKQQILRENIESNIFYTAPEQIRPNNRRMNQTYRRKQVRKTVNQNRQRYSPWKSQQTFEELLV